MSMHRGRIRRWTPATALGIVLGVAALAVGLAATALSLGGLQEVDFPHERHQGLFPLCTGCHEGVPDGDPSDYYPEAGSCAGCHDGIERDRVTWSGPTRAPDNVEFQHVAHAEALTQAGDPEQACASCHVPQGGGRMAVSAEIQTGTCFGCHQHAATEHQTDGDCAVCHVPLAESRFSVARIEALPVPSDHEPAAFLEFEHGAFAVTDGARCATCHTRERCLSCHVNPDLEAIAAIPAAPLGMELPPAVAHYNEPATHGDQAWYGEHGGQASRDACATCHTSDDCASCHVAPAPAAVALMPGRSESRAPGVRLVARAPSSHESMLFMQAHPTLAAADDRSCATCHVESFCVACHDGPVGGGYHPTNFVSRHTASAFGRDTDCANCHNTQAFCRECHQQAGLVSAGRLGPGYHDGGPFWLLRHGQAARQDLEGCTSCHKQLDCTQCHGVLGAFKVSPHSAGFDAPAAWARNPRTCLGCHVGNPLNGSQR